MGGFLCLAEWRNAARLWLVNTRGRWSGSVDCRSWTGISKGEPISLGACDQRPVGEGPRNLSMVHAAAALGYSHKVCSVHKAVHPGVRAWVGMGAGAAAAD